MKLENEHSKLLLFFIVVWIALLAFCPTPVPPTDVPPPPPTQAPPPTAVPEITKIPATPIVPVITSKPHKIPKTGGNKQEPLVLPDTGASFCGGFILTIVALGFVVLRRR